MKKVTISINGDEPFETRKAEDVEELLGQMIHIKNTFHAVPDCFFTISSVKKSIVVDFDRLEKLIKETIKDGVVFGSELTKKLVAEL